MISSVRRTRRKPRYATHIKKDKELRSLSERGHACVPQRVLQQREKNVVEAGEESRVRRGLPGPCACFFRDRVRETESVAESVTESETESETETVAGSETESETVSVTVAETETLAVTVAESETESETEAESVCRG